jgi:hypothetical protein
MDGREEPVWMLGTDYLSVPLPEEDIKNLVEIEIGSPFHFYAAFFI